MDIKRFAGISLLLFIFVMGCSGNNGKVRRQTNTEDKVTLAQLRVNWDDYEIYYVKRGKMHADAIMFDPKDNGTKLSGDSWIKIENEETLDEKLKEIKFHYSYARVDIIEGPENQFFGYIYYPYWLHLPVKMVDKRTLYVGSLPMYGSAP